MFKFEEDSLLFPSQRIAVKILVARCVEKIEMVGGKLLGYKISVDPLDSRAEHL